MLPNLSGLTKLSGADFYGAQFSGNIPNFSNLPNLNYLNLGNNILEGNVPGSLIGLPSLNTLIINLNSSLKAAISDDMISTSLSAFLFDRGSVCTVTKNGPNWLNSLESVSYFAQCFDYVAQYVDSATFDGRTLYIPTLRNGSSVIYDIELAYIDGTIFTFKSAGRSTITTIPVISKFLASEGKVVIDKLQYRFETFTNVILMVTPEGNLNVTAAGIIANQVASSVEIYNLTSYSDQYLHSLAYLSESKMNNLEAEVLAVFYPMGAFISEEQPNTKNPTSFLGATYKNILSNKEVNNIGKKVEEFLSKGCLQNPSYGQFEAKRAADEIVDWIQAGGRSGVQTNNCPARRVIFISTHPDMFENPKLELERIIFHEMYHAFQQDLSDCKSNEDSLWIIEAGAEYFAQHMLLEVLGDPRGLANKLLSQGLFFVETFGAELTDPAVAEKGLLVFLYMIQKGWFEESRLLDGSFFHNCGRNREFTASNDFLRIARSAFSNIVQSKGSYRFAE